MITCEYCSVSYQTFQSLCDSCGAPLPGKEATAVPSANLPFTIAQIRQICAAHEDKNKFFPGSAIPSRIWDTAIKSFPVFPQAEDIFLFCDTTPMGSGVWGFVVSQDGLYWKNNTTTQRNFLKWPDFAQRNVKRHKSTLELGLEDMINLAGLSNEANRRKVERLLKDIHAVLTEE